MHSICNVKHSVSKKAHNGPSYDYHFIIKELREEFNKQFPCLGEKTERYITFTVPIEKEVARIDKHGEKLQKIYLTCYNLLIVQNLWQARYQILPIIFMKDFIKLNVNTYTIIKYVRLVELNITITNAFLNSQILKMI